MRILTGLIVLVCVAGGCTGGAAGVPADDIGDIVVLAHSPGNGDTMRTEDSLDGFNALNNPTLTNPGAVTVVFTNSLDLTSVINPDPADPQGTRNVRLFFFDTSQGPFDPALVTVLGVNPPGANVLIPAVTVPTTTNVPNDTLIIRPTGFSALNPMPQGQYSMIVELGVRGADGDGMKGQEFFFFFRVDDDVLGPVVISTVPAPGQLNVDPSTEITITMSETILASTVNNTNLLVNFQPAGSAIPTPVPGFWFTDGGSAPGNNLPALQLDQSGNPGFSGISPRNGVDLVFRPDLTTPPINMTAEDPQDFLCTLRTDPPRKGNKGFPLGQSITVSFQTVGIGVTDTAANPVPAGSPNTTFTFEIKPFPDPVYAPNTRGAIFYADTIGVGVIDIDPARTPYIVGPNPARAPNTVVTSGSGAAQSVVRVPIPDIVDITTDPRPFTSFQTFVCSIPSPTIFMSNVYAASKSAGEVVVIDSFRMVPFGRFGTPSPGGIGITANGAAARVVVSNFSANTMTVYDCNDVAWYAPPSIYFSQAVLINAIVTGANTLILTEEDFNNFFPNQRADPTSPVGPPIIGTIIAGISPTKTKITNLPAAMGVFGPIGYTTSIVGCINAGDNTATFSEIVNLTQSQAIAPDLPGVNLAAQPTDMTFAPPIGPYYFFIASVAGTVEMFTTGFIANRPSVRPESSQNFAPNKIITSITGLKLPSSLQWIPNGNAVGFWTLAILVAETGENRIQQLGVTALFPGTLFETINETHPAGLGVVDITGDPAGVGFIPVAPRFQVYYAANAGEGTTSFASYRGGVIGGSIPVPGVQLIASWFSR